MILSTGADFAIILTDLGISVSRTAVTKTINNMTGDEILTDGTPADINGIFHKNSQAFTQRKEGLVEVGDVSLWVAEDQTINPNLDKIAYGGENYRVKQVRLIGETSNVFKECVLYLI